MNANYYNNRFDVYDHFKRNEKELNIVDHSRKLPPLNLHPINRNNKISSLDEKNELANKILSFKQSKLPAIYTQRSESNKSDNEVSPRPETPEISSEKPVDVSWSNNQKCLFIIGITLVGVFVATVGKKNIIWYQYLGRIISYYCYKLNYLN